MRALHFLLVFLVACLVADATAMAKDRNFRAHLSGREEVPPAATRAQGQAIFQLSRDGESLRYQINVANIQNITMAHIHLAPAGQNGPVVAWLYPSAPPPQLIEGRTQGVLAAGVIRTSDLVGPLAGQTLADLVQAMSVRHLRQRAHQPVPRRRDPRPDPLSGRQACVRRHEKLTP